MSRVGLSKNLRSAVTREISLITNKKPGFKRGLAFYVGVKASLRLVHVEVVEQESVPAVS